MKYEVVINKRGRRMYYGTPEGGKKKLVSEDKVPLDVIEVLTAENPVDTNAPKASGEYQQMREEAQDGLSEDTSVETRKPDEPADSTLAEDEKLLVDEDEYDIPKEDPEIESKKFAEGIPLQIRGCVFNIEHGKGTKIKRVNLTTVSLCDECYATTTPGKIAEQLNKIRSGSVVT